jgi:hypothetical protein
MSRISANVIFRGRSGIPHNAADLDEGGSRSSYSRISGNPGPTQSQRAMEVRRSFAPFEPGLFGYPHSDPLGIFAWRKLVLSKDAFSQLIANGNHTIANEVVRSFNRAKIAAFTCWPCLKPGHLNDRLLLWLRRRLRGRFW